MSLAAATDKFCSVCGTLFHPRTTLASVCSPPCAIKLGKGFSRDRRASVLRERKQTRERRAALKTIPDLIKEAQREFNGYIRARDTGTNCICCGKPFEPQKPGGSMDAGHYLARSIAPQHRFNENNVFGQRKNCNRPGGTTRAAFRAGVIQRIGLPALEALEADTAVPKWTREGLVALKAEYRQKLRELMKGRG